MLPACQLNPLLHWPTTLPLLLGLGSGSMEGVHEEALAPAPAPLARSLAVQPGLHLIIVVWPSRPDLLAAYRRRAPLKDRPGRWWAIFVLWDNPILAEGTYPAYAGLWRDLRPLPPYAEDTKMAWEEAPWIRPWIE